MSLLINWKFDNEIKRFHCDNPLCNQEIGYLDADDDCIVHLDNIRRCKLEHASTLSTHNGAEMIDLRINRLVESRKLSSPYNLSQFLNNSSVSFDSPVFPEPVATSTPKADHVAEAIERVVSGQDVVARRTRAKIEFIDLTELPTPKGSPDNGSDLAKLLPGEKMPVFKY